MTIARAAGFASTRVATSMDSASSESTSAADDCCVPASLSYGVKASVSRRRCAGPLSSRSRSRTVRSTSACERRRASLGIASCNPSKGFSSTGGGGLVPAPLQSHEDASATSANASKSFDENVRDRNLGDSLERDVTRTSTRWGACRYSTVGVCGAPR
jgi:hypothetical protein